MTWKHGRQTPDNNLMRFVARRFPEWDGVFLDIGSGEDANARELRFRGFHVVTIDKDPEADAYLCDDIRDVDFDPGFDCIYDINTLCHVDRPPFEKIKSWLKPDGVFFSICPTLNTSERVKEGKEFTRLASEYDLVAMLKMFSQVKIGSAHSHLPGEDCFRSWIVEAHP